MTVEFRSVRRTFEPLAPFVAFELQSGQVPGCESCRQYDGHLFSNWFHDVAWDWCFCLVAERAGLAWVACLTDTN